MSRRSFEFGVDLESPGDEIGSWRYVIPVFGVVLLVSAIVKSALALVSSGVLLEAALDLALISTPGIAMLYIGHWLPETTIPSELYPRIVTWVFGGVAVMAFVMGLRVIHPGVSVRFTFGTQAVLLSIGSLAGLGIGIHEAQALTHARTLEERNETLNRTERRLEEVVAELEASNEQLEQFAHAASHDLQEPLRMVTNYLELLEDRCGDELDDDGEEFLAYAVDGAERMHAMIDGLLEYSRVDTQGEPFEAVDLDAVLDDVLTDLQFRIDETDTELTREPLPTVEGDERQLQQLFQNLLTNAIDYSGDDPPRIHVSATREGATRTVSVRDEGVGIDSDDADRIFDVFQRLNSADERAGSGIGLALCDRIVDRHGGEIRVDSASGAGSTFSFTLTSGERAADPAAVERPDAPDDVERSESNAQFGGKCPTD
ncbi:histidine kinase [Haloterrigena sp. SYSU A558-1]|uniref:histidine kinase n=1 Tax=Haloterrigena gelatinilytica TaxID=2741724 RepID=A0ABX2LDR6_9EURY|nr:ATP-binding protein [Haloterrigena gelatinilytica]NUC70891.1 histidine kinase [Haloterrigena gelatinilytica]